MIAVSLILASPGAAELIGHGGAIKGVGISVDGQGVITASFDCTLMLWDLNRETELRTLDAHEDPANGVAILPDGRHAVSASDDGSLRLSQLGSDRILHASESYQSKIAQVARSPDGVLERLSVDRDQFDVGKSARSARRSARRDADASGKPRNAAERPICPTAGRVLSRTGVVSRLFRYPRIAMRRAPSQRAKSSQSNGSYQPRTALVASAGWDRKVRLRNLLGS